MMKLDLLLALALTSAGAVFSAAPASAQQNTGRAAPGVPLGVYDCFGPSKAGGVPDDVGTGIRGVGTELDAGGKFSVLGPDLYLSRGGKTGHFHFDGLTLTMVDGPYAGIRYHKVAAWSFRMLRDNGVEGPFMCPRNTAKDPRNPKVW